MVKVYFNGLMELNIMDSGRTIRCMAKESSDGLMVVCM